MRIPRRFVWTGADDNKSTHLALKKDGVYMTADVSQGLLLKFMGEGKLQFIEDNDAEKIPDDVVLEVQKVTISKRALIERLGVGVSVKK